MDVEPMHKTLLKNYHKAQVQRPTPSFFLKGLKKYI
jgi:hypothetical protein